MLRATNQRHGAAGQVPWRCQVSSDRRFGRNETTSRSRMVAEVPAAVRYSQLLTLSVDLTKASAQLKSCKDASAFLCNTQPRQDGNRPRRSLLWKSPQVMAQLFHVKHWLMRAKRQAAAKKTCWGGARAGLRTGGSVGSPRLRKMAAGASGCRARVRQPMILRG